MIKTYQQELDEIGYHYWYFRNTGTTSSFKYTDVFGDWRYSDTNLRQMCDDGVKLLNRSDNKDTLRFDVLTKHEVEVVEDYMNSSYPTIKYFCTRLF